MTIQNMRNIFLAALIGTAGASGLGQERSILSFYPTADSIVAYPSPIGRYEIKCWKKISSNYVTFIGKKGEKRVLIAAVTTRRLKNLRSDISLTVQFHGPRPYFGDITTWGYIFDRNGDGLIDYMALVAGAAAVEDEKIPEDFPGFQQAMSKQQFELYISHTRIVFNHWADDDYDGRIDAAVQYDMNPFRSWVRRYLLIRCTKFDDRFDDVRAFRGKISTATASANFTPEEVPYYPMGESQGKFTTKLFAENSNIMALINRAARSCGLGAANFTSRLSLPLQNDNPPEEPRPLGEMQHRQRITLTRISSSSL